MNGELEVQGLKVGGYMIFLCYAIRQAMDEPELPDILML